MINGCKLGLDVSTSCTGVVILDCNGKFVLGAAFDFKNKNKFPNMFSKAQKIDSFLQEIKSNYPIDKITIESALQMFRPGASSATTISTLMKFNGIVSWLSYKVFGQEPEFLSAATARKVCGIKIPKGTKAKIAVMDHLIKNESQFIPFIKYTRTGSIAPHVYDIADAFVIAKASLT